MSGPSAMLEPMTGSEDNASASHPSLCSVLYLSAILII
jgi:hypothetical protein